MEDGGQVIHRSLQAGVSGNIQRGLSFRRGSILCRGLFGRFFCRGGFGFSSGHRGSRRGFRLGIGSFHGNFYFCRGHFQAQEAGFLRHFQDLIAHTQVVTVNAERFAAQLNGFFHRFGGCNIFTHDYYLLRYGAVLLLLFAFLGLLGFHLGALLVRQGDGTVIGVLFGIQFTGIFKAHLVQLTLVDVLFDLFAAFFDGNGLDLFFGGALGGNFGFVLSLNFSGLYTL